MFTRNEGFIATSSDPVSEIPSTLHIHSVYPNPLHREGVIDVDLANDGVVRIQVFDLLGREITELHNTFLQAGRRQLPITLDVPAGLYMLAIEQDGIRSTITVVAR